MTKEDRAKDFVHDLGGYLEDMVLHRALSDDEMEALRIKFRFHAEKPWRSCPAPETGAKQKNATKYCDDPDNCNYSDCPTAFCDRYRRPL